MTLATALATGPAPQPQLAELAVHRAMEQAGVGRANGVLLFLSPHFTSLADASVRAAARASRCLQIMGGFAHGLFTAHDWALDRPAAAAMILADQAGLGPVDAAASLIHIGGAAHLPTPLQHKPRFGLFHPSAPTWYQGRLGADAQAQCGFRGLSTCCELSSGLELLSPDLQVSGVAERELLSLGGTPAALSLLRALPPALRQPDNLPLHLVCLLRPDPGLDTATALARGAFTPLSLLLDHPDQSLSLSDTVQPGETLAWAIRLPKGAERDMGAALTRLRARQPGRPAAGLMLSCLGRGPYFYGGEDRDLAVWRDHFPGVPLLGAYGSGQIAPVGSGCRQWHNAVVTVTFHEES
ncbi:MAG: hypothetical protein RIR00_2425 [Pseudomonadota bacterium]|jgi:hypothetical protein